MLDTGEEDGYLIASVLCHLASKEQTPPLSVRCLLTSSAFLPAPAPDASLHSMPAYLLTLREGHGRANGTVPVLL